MPAAVARNRSGGRNVPNKGANTTASKTTLPSPEARLERPAIHRYTADLIPNRLRHDLTNIVSHHLPYGVKSPRAFNTSTVSLAVMLAVPSSTARNSSPLIGRGAGGGPSTLVPSLAEPCQRTRWTID